MVFKCFLRVFDWFYFQKAALQIHRFSIDLGVVTKTLDALSN